jgi:hypothetical protein
VRDREHGALGHRAADGVQVHGRLASDESLQGWLDAIVDIYDRFTLALSNMKIEIINFPRHGLVQHGRYLDAIADRRLQSQMPNLSGTPPPSRRGGGSLAPIRGMRWARGGVEG